MLLVTGIVLRYIGLWGSVPYFIIGLGALNKITYLVLSIKNKKYKPGYELLVLYSGLTLFFTGLYYRNNNLWEYASILMSIGISFKIGFLILFIRKFRIRVQKKLIADPLK